MLKFKKNMKNLFGLLLIILLITSCSKKVECNGTDEKKLLIENLEKALLIKGTELKLLINSELDLNLKPEEVNILIMEFLEFLEFSNVRTLKIEKDINLCHCNTGLKLKNFDFFYNNLIKKGGFDLNSEEDKNNIDKIKNVFEKEFKVDYKVQYTEDNKLFIETDNESFLNDGIVYELFGMFLEMKQFNKKHSIDIDKENIKSNQEKNSEASEIVDYEAIWKEADSEIDSDKSENFNLITNTFKEFIPKGFSVKSFSKGDANLDGLTDTMLILENNSNIYDSITMILLLKQKNGSHKLSFINKDILEMNTDNVKIDRGRIFILKYYNAGMDISFFKYEKTKKKWILIESCSAGVEDFNGKVWKAEENVSIDEAY